MKHILRAIVGPQSGAVIVLGRRTTLGRASDCDVQILHAGVSRHHVKLSLDGDAVTLTDLSSDNGTFVNDQRVSRLVLNPGDSVRVATSRFAYEVMDDAVPVETADVYSRKITSGESLRRTGPIQIHAPPPGYSGTSHPASRPPTEPGRRTTAEGMPRASAERGGKGPWRGSPAPPLRRPAAGEASGTYSAGHSGSWRRSIEETTRRPPTAARPVVGAADARAESLDSPVPASALSRSGVLAEGVTEPPPVTSGSGAFKRPEAPRKHKVTGRYGFDEVGTALEGEAEHLVPPAARGGSVTVSPRAKSTAELPAREVEDAQFRQGPEGAAVPASEPFGAPGGPVAIDLPPGWGPPEPGRIDDEAATRVRGSGEAAVPRPRPAPAGDAAAEAGRKATTAEYPSASPGGFPLDDAEPDPSIGGLPSGTDPRAMEALASALNRRTDASLRADDRSAGLEDLGAGDGSAALAAVLQYREFRLRTLQGGSLTAVERRRYDHLDRVLQRVVTDEGSVVAMRRFTRFSCELPGELGWARPDGMQTLPIAVYDLGAGGARIDVGRTDLPTGEVVWLMLDLTHVEDLPKPGAHNVVFRCRVVWIDGSQMGVVFAGAPKYDSPMGL